MPSIIERYVAGVFDGVVGRREGGRESARRGRREAVVKEGGRERGRAGEKVTVSGGERDLPVLKLPEHVSHLRRQARQAPGGMRARQAYGARG